MDIISNIIELIVLAFLVGAVLGGVLAAHLQNKPSAEQAAHLEVHKNRVKRFNEKDK